MAQESISPVATDTSVVTDAIQTPEDDTAQARQERALVAQWSDKIKRSQDMGKDIRKEWKTWRRYASGKPAEGERDWLVSTNLIEATIEGLLPSLYAQDPDISVVPAEAVNPQDYGQTRLFGKTVQIVVSRMLWQARMKARMQRMVRSAMVVGMGWIKVAMQLDTVKDPIIQRRITDLQDQVARIQYLDTLLTERNVGPETQDAAVAELQDQIAALHAKVQVMKASGIVVDTVCADDVIVDGELRELADYQYANWIAHRVWYTVDAAKQKFALSDEEILGASTFTREKDDDGDAEASRYVTTTDKKDHSFVACWEIWDNQAQTVYTWLEGCKKWARAPFQPSPAGSRFYPFFMLAFHWQPDMRWPQSDVQMWHKLQDEYARTRSSYAQHRQRARPARVFDKRKVNSEDAKKLFDPEVNEAVGVDPGDQPVNHLVAIIPYPPIDPALYDTSAIRSDLEQVSGLGDAQRAAVVQPKTATEAGIVAQSAHNRVSVRQDSVEDVLEEVCVYIAELALQSMSPQDAIKYAGQGAVWPKLTLDQLHTLLDISIQSGTAGKPNAQQDQQVWTQVGPQLWQAIGAIDGAMKNGDMGLVEAYKNLLSLTLVKFNLKMDVNEIIPQTPPSPPPKPPPDAKQDDIMIRNGSMTIDEARAERGLPPLPGAVGATPLVYNRNGAIPLSVSIAGGIPIQSEVVAGSMPPPFPGAPAPIPSNVRPPAPPGPIQAPPPGQPGMPPRPGIVTGPSLPPPAMPPGVAGH